MFYMTSGGQDLGRPGKSDAREHRRGGDVSGGSTFLGRVDLLPSLVSSPHFCYLADIFQPHSFKTIEKKLLPIYYYHCFKVIYLFTFKFIFGCAGSSLLRMSPF